jgi:hypothetical protein
LLTPAHTLREEQGMPGVPGSLGFPAQDLAPLPGAFSSNVGRPESGDFGARPYERAVLEYFATAYAAGPLEHTGAAPGRFSGVLSGAFDWPPAQVAATWHPENSGNLARTVTVGHITRAVVGERADDPAAAWQTVFS